MLAARCWSATGFNSVGGRITNGVTNRVITGRLIRLASVNGATATAISGAGSGPRVRCVYLSAGTSLSGFTLTNGATLTVGDTATRCSGGGIWCETPP